jgi:hypothetical protein
MDDNGWPKTQGVSWDSYFTENYYRRQVPVWKSYGPGLFSEAGVDWRLLIRLMIVALACGALFTRLVAGVMRHRVNK